jgi:hypothetical protein
MVCWLFKGFSLSCTQPPHWPHGWLVKYRHDLCNSYGKDTLLDLDEGSWALSLAHQALDNDSECAMAYWQKGYTEEKPKHHNETVAVFLEILELLDAVPKRFLIESYFENVKDRPDFNALGKQLMPT